jgi:hypothetical protein
VDATEKLRKAAGDARLIALNEAVILPFLDEQIEVHTASLVADLHADRAGTANMAMIAAYRSIKNHLAQKLKTGNRAYERLSPEEPTT